MLATSSIASAQQPGSIELAAADYPADAGEFADSSGDILVTARRREERAQDVPVAFSVVSAETLSQTGAVNLGQISQLVPALQLFSFNPRNTNVNIRGLGSNVALASDGFEQGVGIFIDGVYYGRIGQSQFDLVDLQQVEVLRGPQGTLYGKNTTAGAINITTRAPSFEPEGRAEITLGNYGRKEWRFSASGPLIGDVAALRLSAAWSKRDGTIHNVRTDRDVFDQDNLSLRGQLLLRPADALEIRIIGDLSQSRTECCINVLVQQFDSYDNGAAIANNFAQRIARAGYTPLPFSPFERQVDADGRFRADMDGYGVSGQVDWDLGGATLTSITAARWWDWNPANDGDQIGLPVLTLAQQVNRQRQFSQELRLGSNGERAIDWQIGLYYFRQVIRGYGTTGYGSAAPNWFLPAVPGAVSVPAISGFVAESYSDPRTWSYAGFGQINWSLTERLKLTGGLRLTHEKKSGTYSQWHATGADLGLLPPALAAAAQGIRNSFNPVASVESSFSDTSVSGLVNAAYQLGGDVIVYASYQRGEKSGGLNLSVLPAGIEPDVKPETVDNFEIGLKSQFLDRRVTLNLAAYLTEVHDFQTTITEQVPSSDVNAAPSFRQYIANIPHVRSKGFEADASWAVTERIRFSGSVAYTDARYIDYPNAPSPAETLNLNPITDLSGEPLSGVPKWSWTLGADGSQPVGSIGGRLSEFYGSADWNYRSSYYTNVSNSRYSLVDGYGLLGGRIGIRSEDGILDISVFARNLLGKDHFQTLSPNAYGVVTAILGEPRTWGVTLRSRF
ncbi:TonB-dependent receptor [Sandaracinobacter sp. RS1-74]|uniref:TonB-dependent receptor n=1 Tax=Sandaracinobacteroides sayramensis TaxID=2913411 RepID=UPI001EDAA76F|nr:TonB-dependent receptor [Sandaracinobacteroides sayramensis]MCG2840270.1 TonB-dependent receptor [Sandaracinobacteroides sayramensis]